MPKKGTRHVRDPGPVKKCQKQQLEPASDVVRSKHFRSVHIGLSNGRRWLSLKKRLGLRTDEDLAVYLLDLADSIARREGKRNEPEETWKKDCDKENDLEIRKNDVDVEEPLRRSRRKQNSSAPSESEVPSEETAQPVKPEIIDEVVKFHVRRSSRTKQHKSKTKHHKEKRKKRKHDKSIENNESTAEKEAIKEAESTLKNVEPSSAVVEAEFETSKSSEATKKLDEKSQQDPQKKEKSIEDFSLFQDLTASTTVNGIEPEISNTEKSEFSTTENLNKSVISQVLEKHQPVVVLQTLSDAFKENLQNAKKKDERKIKKRKKRPKHEELATENDVVEDTTHKHRKKKHKHEAEHKNKKQHDVRKAPQDGIVVQEEEEIEDAEEPIINLGTETAVPEENVDDLALSEPQRLAIKIKLCQDCNSRHLQDACPFATPQYKIDDSTTLEDWLEKHKEKLEVARFVNSEDPMSEGYGRAADDASESDEDTNSPEQYKSKVKSEQEENQVEVDSERPFFARDSLPDCFEFKLTNTKHGLGVYVKQSVPMYAKLGPLVGTPVKEMDIPDDFSMRHIWEMQNGGKTSYVSTTNPLNSNWIRYVRPSYRKEDRSASVVTKQGQLYLITTRNLVIGMELTYWADSQSSAWNKKNKMDKTNCGGCNLNFLHSIYYRLHCWIFHDTNYSLTIRKYHCKVCGAAVLGKDNIVKHAAELHAGRGAYQCQYCKKFFLRLNYLEMHRTYGCSQNPQRSRPLCDFCGRKFCQPQKLKVHIKRMHSDMSEVLREFQCKSCLKLLGSRAALQRHMKEVHHKDVVGAATCDRCGKMFQNKSNLKIHMLTHSGVKPFKCKEHGCKAAFTTKQCLQFHYKKVHGLTETMMPKIERSVAYTFDAYSGGLVEDTGRGKTPRFNRNSQDNSNSAQSMDDCSSESLRMENTVPELSTVNNAIELTVTRDLRTPPASPQNIAISMDSNLDPNREDVDIYGSLRLQSKGSKKWLGEFNPPPVSEQLNPTPPDIYEFEEDRKDQVEKAVSSQVLMDDNKLAMSVYRRPESTSASLLVEAALDAAERAIGAVSNPILKESERDSHLYNISSQLQSPIPPRSPETHLDSYIQQQDELMSPAPAPDGHHTPPSHMHIDYQLHRPLEYINPVRTHNIEQYLHHEDIPRVVSPNAYIQVQQEELGSPSATPTPRYQDLHHHHHHHHHHQVSSDNLSSDEGDSVAQNLSLSVKEKALQLDLSTSYKYDTLDPEFGRERGGGFEPLVLGNGELQGLDMSARGYHQGFGTQVQNARYHHHHIYEISERESVDLSRTGGYSIAPTSPPPPSYPHTDVLRVVSLDLTPGGRPHTVDLSLSRPHHLHTPGARLLSSPLPVTSATSHVSPDNMESRILSSSPPPPPLPAYNPAYPVSPAPHHIPRSGYHHYTGYY